MVELRFVEVPAGDEMARLDAEISDLKSANRMAHDLISNRDALIEIHKTEIARLRQLLGQACRQWKMYADLQEDRDLATEQSVEGALYRKCANLEQQPPDKDHGTAG